LTFYSFLQLLGGIKKRKLFLLSKSQKQKLQLLLPIPCQFDGILKFSNSGLTGRDTDTNTIFCTGPKKLNLSNLKFDFISH
jgi:hypothetical protein